MNDEQGIPHHAGQDLPEYSMHIQIVEMRKDLQYIVKMFEDFKTMVMQENQKNEEKYATKAEVAKLRTEFLPVKLAVFALIGLIVLSVVGNWLDK